MTHACAKVQWLLTFIYFYFYFAGTRDTSSHTTRGRCAALTVHTPFLFTHPVQLSAGLAAHLLVVLRHRRVWALRGGDSLCYSYAASRVREAASRSHALRPSSSSAFDNRDDSPRTLKRRLANQRQQQRHHQHQPREEESRGQRVPSPPREQQEEGLPTPDKL